MALFDGLLYGVVRCKYNTVLWHYFRNSSISITHVTTACGLQYCSSILLR